MSSPENPQPQPGTVPPVEASIPPIIQDSNPFSSPKSIEDSFFPQDTRRAAPLGVGYWVSVVASLCILLYLVLVTPEASIFVGWILFFAAIRVPLRDVRRRSLNNLPTMRRMLLGAGDYLISLALCAGLTFAMCTVFLTVCTATALGLSAMNINEESFIAFAFGGGGLAALTSFLLLFTVSLRM
jgi:hypothetical protein